MPKFDIGDWARPKGQKYCGRICGYRRHKVLIRWAGSQKAEPWSSRTLVGCDPPRALVLEGSLDDDLESTRSEEHLLRTWLGSSGIPVAYRNILTLQDLRIISRAAGSKWPVFVHISCHGQYDGHRPYITLVPKARRKDRIYLDDPKTVAVFQESFPQIPLLFSACLLGKYGAPITTFRKEAGLSAVAVFTREVYDSETMLFELLLYQGMLVNGWTFRKAVDSASTVLTAMGLQGNRGRKFVRVF